MYSGIACAAVSCPACRRADDPTQGGGQVLAFATRPQAPPSRVTVALLSGVIAGGPLIRLTFPPPAYQVIFSKESM